MTTKTRRRPGEGPDLSLVNRSFIFNSDQDQRDGERMRLIQTCWQKQSRQQAPRRRRKRPRASIASLATLAITCWSFDPSSALKHDRYSRRSLQLMFIPAQFRQSIPPPLETNVTSVPTRAPFTLAERTNITYSSQDGFGVWTFPPTDSPMPSPSPSAVPSGQPSKSSGPTNVPTSKPTDTGEPSPSPSDSPTLPSPTMAPTLPPTKAPTPSPTTSSPSQRPTTSTPSISPTTLPPTPSPSTIKPTSRPSLSLRPSQQPTPSPTLTPTRPPTLSPKTLFPTPQPTINPTPQPTIVPTPQPTINPTPQPTINPTPQPTINPTPQPTINPTPQPTINPTPQPTPEPTIALTPMPTPQPTRNPSRQPTSLPTPIPTYMPSVRRNAIPSSSMSPTTIGPSTRPTGAPTGAPTVLPTRVPSWSPSTTVVPSRSGPTIVPSVLPSSQPTLVLDPVAISPFDVLLLFNQPLNQQNASMVAQELEVRVADYIVLGLSRVNFGQGVTLESMNLNVTAPNVTTVNGTVRRRLQQQSLNYKVDGNANFGSTATTPADPNFLRQQLDASMVALLNDPAREQSFTAFLQSSPGSQILQSTSSASAKAQVPTPPEEGKKRPSPVSIVFGFLLVGLAIASLLFYMQCWCKKLVKKRAQRKRERESVVATPPSPRPSVRPGFLASTVAREEESSEDDSSYEGISESSSDVENDAFARELKLAATLDKRAWEDYQQRRKQLEENGMVVGRLPPRPPPAPSSVALSSVATYRDEDEGVEIADQGATLIISPIDEDEDEEEEAPPPLSPSNTFPYGDEDNGQGRSEGAQLISLRQLSPGLKPVSPGQASPEQTQEALGIKAGPLAEPENPSESVFRSISASNGDGAHKTRKRNLPPSELPETKRKADRLSPLTLSRASPNTISSSLEALGSPRASISDPMMRSSPATTIVVGNLSKDDVRQNKIPLLSLDIVNEVKKLTQFVRSYEERREHEKLGLDDLSETDSSQHSWSSNSKEKNELGKYADDADEMGTGSSAPGLTTESMNSMSSEEGSPEKKAALDSRLGITPFSANPIDVEPGPQLKAPVIAARRDLSRRLQPIAVSRPPITGGRFGSTQLSPIPGTPRTPASLPSTSPEDAMGNGLDISGSPAHSQQENMPTEESTPSPRKLGSPRRNNSLKEWESPKKALIEDVRPTSVAEDGRGRPSTLKSLRMRDAVIDTDSDVDLKSSGMSPKPTNGDDVQAPSTPVHPITVPSPPSSQKRSSNKAFTNIISMFENRKKEAIFPPNESWQYNS